MFTNSTRHKTAAGRRLRLRSLLTGRLGARGATRAHGSKVWMGRLALLIGPKVGAPVGSPLVTPGRAVRVKSRDDGVTVQCRCGHFSLSFHSIAVARQGRFRCLICGTEEAIADLIDADGRPRVRSTGAARRNAPL